ncbi:hypothetical protein, partial [Klebsiella pneumoniae]
MRSSAPRRRHSRSGSIANHQHGQKTSIRPILFLYLLGTF